MIIECPQCGTKNTAVTAPQLDKAYRCGKCGAEIIFLQTVATQENPHSQGQPVESPKHIQTADSSQGQPIKDSVSPEEISSGKGVLGVTGDYYINNPTTNIYCLECGRLNRFTTPLLPENKYICGDCGATIRSAMTSYPTSPNVDVQQVTSTHSVLQNTSGQGKLATVPREVEGWNWGAFLLGIIWGVGNNVWMSFLLLVPIFDIIWIFVLGINGNKWAWQNKRWDSIEHFKRTQEKWRDWGMFFTAIVVLIGFVIGLINMTS